jgi:hypothetical protein
MMAMKTLLGLFNGEHNRHPNRLRYSFGECQCKGSAQHADHAVRRSLRRMVVMDQYRVPRGDDGQIGVP